MGGQRGYLLPHTRAPKPKLSSHRMQQLGILATTEKSSILQKSGLCCTATLTIRPVYSKPLSIPDNESQSTYDRGQCIYEMWDICRLLLLNTSIIIWMYHLYMECISASPKTLKHCNFLSTVDFACICIYYLYELYTHNYL